VTINASPFFLNARLMVAKHLQSIASAAHTTGGITARLAAALANIVSRHRLRHRSILRLGVFRGCLRLIDSNFGDAAHPFAKRDEWIKNLRMLKLSVLNQGSIAAGA
jgi:hypothetical protein